MNATTQTENPKNRKPERNFLSIKQQTRENLGRKETRTHTHIIHIYKHRDTYTHNSSSILVTLKHETQVPLPPLSTPGREHNTRKQKTKNQKPPLKYLVRRRKRSLTTSHTRPRRRGRKVKHQQHPPVPHPLPPKQASRTAAISSSPDMRATNERNGNKIK
jgi:hypothetical protein